MIEDGSDTFLVFWNLTINVFIAKWKSVLSKAKHSLNGTIWYKTDLKVENITQGTTTAQRQSILHILECQYYTFEWFCHNYVFLNV